MEIKFHQQNLQDAVILYAEDQTDYDRNILEAELLYNEHEGFYTNIFISSNSYPTRAFNQQELIDSIALYLVEEHNFLREDLGIELFFDEEEGFTAIITVE